MKKFMLSAADIRQLIEQYQGELRRLEFQFYKAQETLGELEAMLRGQADYVPASLPEAVVHPLPPAATANHTEESVVAEEVRVEAPAAEQPKRKGRPRKNSETETAASAEQPQAAETPKEEEAEEAKADYVIVPPTAPGTSNRTRELNDMDQAVMEQLQINQRLMTSMEIEQILQTAELQKNPELDVEQYHEAFLRCMHKLSNRHGALIKVHFRNKGRANMLALPEWLNASGTTLKKRFLPKE